MDGTNLMKIHVDKLKGFKFKTLPIRLGGPITHNPLL